MFNIQNQESNTYLNRIAVSLVSGGWAALFSNE